MAAESTSVILLPKSYVVGMPRFLVVLAVNPFLPLSVRENGEIYSTTHSFHWRLRHFRGKHGCNARRPVLHGSQRT